MWLITVFLDGKIGGIFQKLWFGRTCLQLSNPGFQGGVKKSSRMGAFLEIIWKSSLPEKICQL